MKKRFEIERMFPLMRGNSKGCLFEGLRFFALCRLPEHREGACAQNDSKKAFTLAEVLITLGIIGVVAAVTIPALIQNYNTKTWNTSSDVFSKKLIEALKIMNTQQTLAGHTTTEEFAEELGKHFKISKVCDNEKLKDCFSDIIYWGGDAENPKEINIETVKTAKNLGQNDWNTNVIGVQFANGTSALLAYNPITTGEDACTQDPHSNLITGSNCIAIAYDTNGFKSPNTNGKDLRSYGALKKLGNSCGLVANDTCFAATATYVQPMSQADCETQKGDLGINACNANPDYWAAAVKACGGVSKMPSQAQLNALAKYVYNDDSIAIRGLVTGVTLDPAKAASAGISSGIYVWAKEEMAGNVSYGWVFDSNQTYYAKEYRHDGGQGYLTLCIGE